MRDFNSVYYVFSYYSDISFTEWIAYSPIERIPRLITLTDIRDTYPGWF